eukprot:CAMPEP_0171906630 /NCGR_PEP_ID=MMETSP0993-20121228/6307_1 /TAXON_ID=483369 /ORGANISM="non described non described, Strain CCMP2098" /LENGTH=82 /DNA_ID=CAMNT_0012538609 /DNA_START=186 /DNA_END=432 /DNA_ORIENTATION=+
MKGNIAESARCCFCAFRKEGDWASACAGAKTQDPDKAPSLLRHGDAVASEEIANDDAAQLLSDTTPRRGLREAGILHASDST